jgi:hypothetical protein
MKELEGKNLDDLLSECDSLLEQLKTELYNDLAEENRLRLEIQQAALEKSKDRVENVAESVPGRGGSFSEGMHEAIDDLVRAIRETARLLR